MKLFKIFSRKKKIIKTKVRYVEIKSYPEGFTEEQWISTFGRLPDHWPLNPSSWIAVYEDEQL